MSFVFVCVINRRRRGAEKQTGKGPFFHDPSFSFSSRNSSIPTFIFLLCIVTDICFDSCVLILEAVHIHLHEARVWLLVKMFVCNSDFFFRPMLLKHKNREEKACPRPRSKVFEERIFLKKENINFKVNCLNERVLIS